MKSVKYFLIILLLFLGFGCSLTVSAAAFPDITARAAIVIDYSTGKILYQKNAYERRPPASTTKIMTAIVALERGTLKKLITVSDKASRVGGSSIWLAPGESHSLEDLLYGLLLSSGNDASVAVAEGLAGSEKKFALWMTQKAHALGARNSEFKNCTGLPEEGHLTTAYDLAVITRYALRNPVFGGMVKTRKKMIKWPRHKWERVMYNHNKLLWRYEFADGVKTGYTRQAGKCLVSSATRDSQRLIVVVLNSKDTYRDSEKLLNYGFVNFRLVQIISPEENLGEIQVIDGVLSRVPVIPNRSLTLVVPRGLENKLKVSVNLQKSIEAPVERLQKVGELQVKLGEKVIGMAPVITAVRIPRQNFFWRLRNWFK